MTSNSSPTFVTALLPLAHEGSIAIRVDYDSGNVISNSEMEWDTVTHLLGIAVNAAGAMTDELNDEIEKTMMRDGISPDVNFCTRYGTEKKILIANSSVKIEISILIPRLSIRIKFLFSLVENVLEDLCGHQWNTLDPAGFQVAYEEAEAAYSMAEADGDVTHLQATESEEDEEELNCPSVPLHQDFQRAVEGYDAQGAN